MKKRKIEDALRDGELLMRTCGWVLCKNVLNRDEVRVLRKECDVLASQLDGDDLDDRGCVLDAMEKVPVTEACRADAFEYCNIRKDATNMNAGELTVLFRILFETLPNELLKVVRSEELFLFNEHYVCKPSRSSAEFSWHRDGEIQLAMVYAMGSKYAKNIYYSCWVALDDVSGENGALHFPGDGGDRSEAGDVVVSAEAGDVVVFSSHTLHRSGPNTTDCPRRAFYAQYSTKPIVRPRGGRSEVLSYAIACNSEQSKRRRAASAGVLRPVKKGDCPKEE
eukprot:g4759.t1